MRWIEFELVRTHHAQCACLAPHFYDAESAVTADTLPTSPLYPLHFTDVHAHQSPLTLSYFAKNSYLALSRDVARNPCQHS